MGFQGRTVHANEYRHFVDFDLNQRVTLIFRLIVTDLSFNYQIQCQSLYCFCRPNQSSASHQASFIDLQSFQFDFSLACELARALHCRGRLYQFLYSPTSCYLNCLIRLIHSTPVHSVLTPQIRPDFCSNLPIFLKIR